MKNFILTATLATAALSSTITFSIPYPCSAQTGKNLCKYFALPVAILTTLNGITGKKRNKTKIALSPFNFYKGAYKEQGLLFTSTAFVVVPFGQLLFEQKLSTPDTYMTIGGILAVAGSIVGIRYFNRQIEAQKQQLANNSNNNQTGNPSTTDPFNPLILDPFAQ